MTSTKSGNVQCPIFEDMTLEEREHLLALFDHERYSAGETILREGRSIQILWIIVSGRCEVVKNTNGQERILAVLEQGAVFGEMSFFHPAPHSASVRAMTDVNVMRLSRERYDELLAREPAAAYRVAANTASVQAERLRKMDDWMCDLLDGPDCNARQREEWHEFRAKLYSEWDF
ncbi:MAG: cyclic nucleotide-binding domain-containing protein [Planctomycetaceae bacterium]